MADPFINLPFTLEVHEPLTGVDDWGDELPVSARPSQQSDRWEATPVAGWSVDPVEETTGDAVLRTVDQLTVHFPADQAPDASAWIRLPGGGLWQVEGNPGQWEHSPFGFSPGLVQVKAKKVGEK